MPNPHIVNIIFLIATFALLILTLKNRFYGLLAYTCISFTRPGLYFPFLAKIRFELIVALLVLITIALSKESLERLSLRRNPISRNMFVFFLIVVLSMIQAFDYPTALAATWWFSKSYALYLMIVALVRTDQDLKLFLWCFSFLILYLAYAPVYNYIHGEVIQRVALGESSSREVATYAAVSGGRVAGHVELGIYMLHGLCFVWYLLVSAKNLKERLIGLFLLGFCFIGLMVSGSRGAIVGLAFTIVLISYFSEHRLRYFLLGCVIMVVALSSMSSGYLAYMATILEFGQSDGSASSRIGGLRHGIEMLVKRPVLGVGPGCYPVARLAWFHWGLWSHNIYGQIAGDLGLAGIGAWSVFIYSYLKKCFYMTKSLNANTWFYAIASAVMVANGVSLVLGFFAHTLYTYFWYMSAAIVVAMENINAEQTSLKPISSA